MASGIGGAMLDFGNNYLAKGDEAFSWDGLGEAIAAGLISSLFGCFVGDTFVLMGDGATQIAIDPGQRVATDGGVANSPDGQTAAADPYATQVDPATWRLITVVADDWEIQTLQPLSWIEAYDAAAQHSILLSTIVDVAEMGVPEGLYGTIESISDCPAIEGGTGRVVLTTMSHLNSDVYTLTLTDSDGRLDNLGVTGGHKIYTEDRGWVEASDLTLGEVVRGANGDVVVTSIIRDPGTFRVYNMTVEADHDYYVGDLSALVHNACGRGGKQAKLKSLLNDPNIASGDRGWILQELNAIARGTRRLIRVPPGKNLAHLRGFEARRGFGYNFSVLQEKGLHLLQHMFEGY